MATTVDDKGRIVLPKAVRDAHGLGPGSPVIVEDRREGILLRPALPKDVALKRLAGAINSRTRRKGATYEDPLRLKEIWEPKP